MSNLSPAYRYCVFGTENIVIKSYTPLRKGDFINYQEYGARIPRLARVRVVKNGIIVIVPVVMEHIVPVIRYEDEDD